MVVVVGVMAALIGAPAVARVVADYARNSDKVDGKHSVASNSSVDEAAKKLVALNKNGQLPAKFIPQVGQAAEADHALSADTLGGLPPSEFVQGGGRVINADLLNAGTAQSSNTQVLMNVSGFGELQVTCGADLKITYVTNDPPGTVIWKDEGGTNPVLTVTTSGPGGNGAIHGPVSMASPLDRQVWSFMDPRATLELLTSAVDGPPTACTTVATLYLH